MAGCRASVTRRIAAAAPSPVRCRLSRCRSSSPAPAHLSRLLPPHREEYQFTPVRDASEKNRPVLVIEFTTIERKSRPELIEEGVHDACFDWKGPIATRGRLWVDRDTYEVLRLDRGLHGPVDVKVPWSLQRRYDFGSWVVLERDDLSLRYKRSEERRVGQECSARCET